MPSLPILHLLIPTSFGLNTASSGGLSIVTEKGRGLQEKKKESGMVFWHKRSHIWPKLFCDGSLATMLALEQVLIINDLKGTKE